ncbi:MAG: SspB family protein [Rhodospirillaceae bacterium]
MSNDITSLSYERMVEDALRGVLRQALKITEAQGLPGAHHFYITFDTTHPGLKIAPSLKALHPNEMTIVLQHQFWDLVVGEDRFEITLSFSGVSQRLSVPFAAVTAFADPHAKFGLQFHVEFEERSEDEDDDDDAGDPPLDDEAPAETAHVDSMQVTQQLKNARKTGASRPSLKTVKPDGEPQEPAANKVVTLDAFRKK